MPNYLDQVWRNTVEAFGQHPSYKHLLRRLYQVRVLWGPIRVMMGDRPMTNIARVVMAEGEMTVMEISPLFAECPLPHRVELVAHELYHTILHEDAAILRVREQYGQEIALIAADLVVNQMIDIDMLMDPDTAMAWTRHPMVIQTAGLPENLSIEAYAKILKENPDVLKKYMEVDDEPSEQSESDDAGGQQPDLDGNHDDPDRVGGRGGLDKPASPGDASAG